MKRLKRIGSVLAFIVGISSFVCAQDPSILLERAIYTEETLGNLSDAIGLYQKVIVAAEESRTTSALALYRLGLCYLKNGSTGQAQAAFEKLIQIYPEQRDLISAIPAPSPDQLDLKPVPWANGESLLFSIGYKSGLKAGDLTYRFESTVDSGRIAWRVQCIQNPVQSASALVDAASFIPISSTITEVPTGRQYQAIYKPQAIESMVTMNGSARQKTFPLSRTTYDDQQLVLILRCLPLQEGFQTSIPIFSSNAVDALVDAKIAVVAKERITVPAGTFDCYKTILTRGNQSPSATYWISDDVHSYIVKVNETRLLGGTVPFLVDLELGLITVAEQK